MGANKTSFKKGHKGVSPGRPKLPEDIKAARKMSYEEMCMTVISVRLSTPEELRKEDLEKMPLGRRAIVNAYIKMDYRGIRDYEDRIWGKAKESMDVDIQGAIKFTLNIGNADDNGND